MKKICDFGTVLYPLLLSIKFCTICPDFYFQADGILEFVSFVGTGTLYVLGLTLELLLNSYTTLKFALGRVKFICSVFSFCVIFVFAGISLVGAVLFGPLV